jgi:hypothetical protein
VASIPVIAFENKPGPSLSQARRRARRWGLDIIKQKDGRYTVLRSVRELHREQSFTPRNMDYTFHDVQIVSRHSLIRNFTIPQIIDLCHALDIAAAEFFIGERL